MNKKFHKDPCTWRYCKYWPTTRHWHNRLYSKNISCQNEFSRRLCVHEKSILKKAEILSWVNVCLLELLWFIHREKELWIYDSPTEGENCVFMLRIHREKAVVLRFHQTANIPYKSWDTPHLHLTLSTIFVNSFLSWRWFTTDVLPQEWITNSFQDRPVNHTISANLIDRLMCW